MLTKLIILYLSGVILTSLVAFLFCLIKFKTITLDDVKTTIIISLVSYLGFGFMIFIMIYSIKEYIDELKYIHNKNNTHLWKKKN
ncbi:MAG: hypothetical protein IKT40_12390 [Bacilli bacterium]|nr:hypothetical protein [Bacilli bacterium]